MGDIHYRLDTLNRDLKIVTDLEAIKNSIRNIVTTQKYQVPGNPDFGCDLESDLFEIMDEITYTVIKEKIIEEIIEREPRIILIDVIVTSNFITQQVLVNMIFNLVDENSVEQNLLIKIDI